MARHTSLAPLCNVLVSSKQLLAYRGQQDQPAQANTAIFQVSLVTRTAGILLRLPQEVIAISIILLQRHLIADSDTDLLKIADYSAESNLIRASSGAVYLAAKDSFYHLSPRSVINVYGLLTSTTSSPLRFISSSGHPSDDSPDPNTYLVSEGTYQRRREQLFIAEKSILVSLGFDTKVVLPYTFALTYLQALSASTKDLAERTLAHLNTALLSPQFLYLTHQPNQLAVAAIYLAARDHGIVLVDEEVPWWEVFDVGREELGFLVLSLASIESFAKAQELDGS
ncbi:hypothetical protein LTS08_008573 [Lithohypha guttulata]|nr:hypothetical protein LTS08_008573 [Lithohypha guttulata]